jgi:hypothetical protein
MLKDDDGRVCACGRSHEESVEELDDDGPKTVRLARHQAVEGANELIGQSSIRLSAQMMRSATATLLHSLDIPRLDKRERVKLVSGNARAEEESSQELTDVIEPVRAA